VAAFRLSVRRACWLTSLHRTTWAYRPGPDPNEALLKRLRELAAQHSRWGAPMLYLLLRKEGFQVNHKRVERLYRREGLSLRLKTRKKRARHLRKALPVPVRRDDIWSMDFIHDELSDGRRVKCLTSIDHCTREVPMLHMDHSIRGKDIVRLLDILRRQSRIPKIIVMDNGPEFRSRALTAWACEHDVRLHFIEPGKPTQNAFIESFNGRFRAECLDMHLFRNIAHGRFITQDWRKEYENVRPHSGLNGKTPKEVAEDLSKQVTKLCPPLRFSVVQQ
jgi:putative transposase